MEAWSLAMKFIYSDCEIDEVYGVLIISSSEDYKIWNVSKALAAV